MAGSAAAHRDSHRSRPRRRRGHGHPAVRPGPDSGQELSPHLRPAPCRRRSVTLHGPSGGPVAPTTSDATLVDSWTAQTQTLGAEFDIVPFSVTYALRSTANGQFVTAAATSSPLAAAGTSGTGPGWYDMFSFSHEPTGWGHVSLLWRAHNQYVCAESAGAQPLIANRSAAQWWEMFLLMWNTDGTFSLKAAANDRFVSAPSNGDPLIANQSQIGSGEKFDLVDTLGTTW